MGTPHDAALGLPLEEPEHFDEMTGPMGHVLPGGYTMPSKASAVIADEQRMLDLFRECANAVQVMRLAAAALDGVCSGLNIATRFDSATRLESAAVSLESAIAQANGGAA
jgi:hypothetical protein